MTTKNLVLASSSRYRRSLLEKLHLPFIASTADIDETPRPGEQSEQLALRLAREKALALCDQYPHSLIIGSDQVAVLQGRQLTKPGSLVACVEQLQAAAGNAVEFYTGISLVDSATGECRWDVDRCTVYFRPLSKRQIRRYVELEKPCDCAGGFKGEGLGIALFERIAGNDPNALVGLPLIRLVDLLEQFNVQVL